MIGAFQYAQDVTERLRDQQRLTEAEESLRQSQKMEAVGQLTGGIAHDFNNLLTGIIGSLDMMQRKLARGQQIDVNAYVSAAMTAANRAAALTHRLLAFSRRQALDPRPVHANRLILGMEELLRRTLGEAIGLEFVEKPDLWLTRCDQNQLESALLNLTINARDAMPQGGKLIIQTSNEHLANAHEAKLRDVMPGDYIAISVCDNGVGMSPEVMSRAFDPFFTTKPIGQGTGLGLSDDLWVHPAIRRLREDSVGSGQGHDGQAVSAALSTATMSCHKSRIPCRSRCCPRHVRKWSWSSRTSRWCAIWSSTCWPSWAIDRYRPSMVRAGSRLRCRMCASIC